MCGLSGVAGDIDAAAKNAFNQLLVANFVRGQAASGVANAKINANDTEMNLLKNCVSCFDLMYHKTYDSIATINANVLIGHTRAPTFGTNSKNNAQPHWLEHIMGTHNGTLTGSSKSAMIGGNLCGTDSEALYNNMVISGLKDTVEKLDGAYALVWFNSQDNTLNFLRNVERTLFFAMSENGKQLYWASEAGMLYWILSRNGIKIEKVFAVPLDVHMAFKVPRFFTEKFEDPVRTHMAPPEKKSKTTTTYTATTPSYMGPTRRWNMEKKDYDPNPPGMKWDYKTSAYVPIHGPVELPLLGYTPPKKEEAKVVRITEATINRNRSRILHALDKGRKWRPPYHDEHGQMISKNSFTLGLRNATCMHCCSDGPEWGQPLLFVRFDPKGISDFLCSECLKDDEVVQIAKAIRS